MDWREQKLQNRKSDSCTDKIYWRRNEQTICEVKFQPNKTKIWSINNERLHKLALEMENDQHWKPILLKVY